MAESRTKSKNSLADQMASSENIVVKSKFPEILKHMSNYNYGPEVIHVGEELLNIARFSITDRDSKHGKQIEYTTTATKARAKFHAQYMDIVKFSRITFKDTNIHAVETLRLADGREENITLYTEQAGKFLAGLLSNREWITPLKNYSITEETIHENSKALGALKDIVRQKELSITHANEALRVRDEAVDKLTSWTTRYKEVARIALQNEPHLRDMLGL